MEKSENILKISQDEFHSVVEDTRELSIKNDDDDEFIDSNDYNFDNLAPNEKRTSTPFKLGSSNSSIRSNYKNTKSTQKNSVLSYIAEDMENEKSTTYIVKDFSSKICELRKYNENIKRLNDEIKQKTLIISKTPCDEYEIEILHRKLNSELNNLNKKLNELDHNENDDTLMDITKTNKLKSNDFSRIENDLRERENIIDDLQRKYKIIEQELHKFKNPNCHSCKNNENETNDIENRLKIYKNRTESLERNFDTMTNALKRINMDLSTIQREKFDNPRKSKSCKKCKTSSQHGDEQKIKESTNEMKNQNEQLIKDLANKEMECNLLKKNIEILSSCTKYNNQNQSQNYEIDLIKQKLNESIEKQEQSKILIKEQSSQLEEYRRKYLKAQQKVEEQKCQIEINEIKIHKLEDQLNDEISRLKCKYQTKIEELTPFPKLLEQEHEKLCCLTNENLKLKDDLNKLQKDFVTLRSGYNEMEEEFKKKCSGDKKISNLIEENENMKLLIEKLNVEKKCLETKIEDLNIELMEFKEESARIIQRSKECSNSSKEYLQNQINKMEVELAQCRANSSLILAERDDCIQKMRKQLSNLTENFAEAQEQVKILKNQICTLKK